MRNCKVIMIQGTTSDAGKSLIVAGICRWLSLQGFSVAPFKPQNMSNNAVALPNGGEIGRAQALQALAGNCELSFDLNPILLKPYGTKESEIIIHGYPIGKVKSADFRNFKQNYFKYVSESFERLIRKYDFCIIEGAGGASEINLRKGDIANMGFALPNKIPVVLVADIERGGAIASILGTWEILAKAEQDLVIGFWINKFRGDKSLFTDGYKYIENKIQRPCLGVIPWFEQASLLPAEDSLALSKLNNKTIRSKANNNLKNKKSITRVGILRLASISNFDEFSQMENDENYIVEYLSIQKPLPLNLNWLIIPGSKSVILELRNIFNSGFHHDIYAFNRRGGKILGICGGYSILGKVVIDNDAKDGVSGKEKGLNLLDISTEMQKIKETVKRQVCLNIEVQQSNDKFTRSIYNTVYEIHYGKVKMENNNQSWIISNKNEKFGSVNNNQTVYGCYMHDLFIYKSIRDEFFKKTLFSNQSEHNSVNHVLNAWSKHLYNHSKKSFFESILDLRKDTAYNKDL